MIRARLLDAHVQWLWIREETRLAISQQLDRGHSSVLRACLREWRAVVISRTRARRRICHAQRRQYLCTKYLKRWRRALVLQVSLCESV